MFKVTIRAQGRRHEAEKMLAWQKINVVMTNIFVTSTKGSTPRSIFDMLNDTTICRGVNLCLFSVA